MSNSLSYWDVENSTFWTETGSKRAWKTLTITTLALIFSFSIWFIPSAVVVRLPNVGFKFTTLQLFWLAALPGLAGGTFRLIHMFLIPIYGSRHVITISTFIKLIPVIWLFFAVQDVSTPYSHFVVIALLCGFGGGDFSSFMPSTSLFFPKRLQGAALGIQAGIGNFGVSLSQFITPWIISLPLFGILGGYPQQSVFKDSVKELWLQNAAVWYIPALLVVGVLCWIIIRNVPVKASFKDQLDIFKNNHTYYCTLLYLMTFGSFAGFSATFPLLIKELYGEFSSDIDPLKYAFYGPLIGSSMRALAGSIADKYGGGLITQISGIGLILCCLALVFGGYLQPESISTFNGFVFLMLGVFFFSGIGNASTFRQFPIIFSDNPRQAGGVIGFTSAVAAYGPFIFSFLIGLAISSTGSARPFFIFMTIYFLIVCIINWYFYTRKGAEKPDLGARSYR